VEQPLNQNSEKRKTIEKIERRQLGVADRAGKHSLIGIITMEVSFMHKHMPLWKLKLSSPLTRSLYIRPKRG